MMLFLGECWEYDGLIFKHLMYVIVFWGVFIVYMECGIIIGPGNCDGMIVAVYSVSDVM